MKIVEVYTEIIGLYWGGGKKSRGLRPSTTSTTYYAPPYSIFRPPGHFADTNVNSNNHVINVATYKSFGLLDIDHRVKESI